MTIQIFFLVCGLLQRDGTPLSKMCSDIFIYRLPKLQEWLSARLFEEWCPKFGDKQRSRDKLKVSWEQLPHSPQRKGSDDKTFDCLYTNTHIVRNRKEEICSPHVQSQNYTIFGSTDIWWGNSCDSSTAMDSCKLSKADRKSKSGGVVLHRKDQAELLEISYRQEDRSVNLMVWF